MPRSNPEKGGWLPRRRRLHRPVGKQGPAAVLALSHRAGAAQMLALEGDALLVILAGLAGGAGPGALEMDRAGRPPAMRDPDGPAALEEHFPRSLATPRLRLGGRLAVG